MADIPMEWMAVGVERQGSFLDGEEFRRRLREELSATSLQTRFRIPKIPVLNPNISPNQGKLSAPFASAFRITL
jgi:hypothetical protein